MKKYKKGIIIYWIILVVLYLSISTLFFGCSNIEKSSNLSENGKIIVYTSFYPMYDMAKKIGGDRIELRILIPSSSEPHEWEPGPQDISTLEKADVFIYNGAGMEPWAESILNTLKNNRMVIVDTSKEIDLLESAAEHSHNGDKDDEYYDPHVWLSPQNAKKQMEAIKEAFIEADTKNKEYYEENFLNYSKKMDELDDTYRKAISEFSRKNLVVTHGAFGYLCHAYGLNQVAVDGLSIDSEPSPGKMAEIVNFIRENDVKVIFYEENSNTKVAEAIAREAGIKIMPLNTLGRLSEKDINEGKEYFSIMMENLKSLEAALK
ncbi:MAG TPA: zinc ABC transporter solute-binding protein [Clostridiaceae bacterium]|nr:zinc ABC transporter solute-binding protein [Clostridiaceae bacterium]